MSKIRVVKNGGRSVQEFDTVKDAMIDIQNNGDVANLYVPTKSGEEIRLMFFGAPTFTFDVDEAYTLSRCAKNT